jgi:hypothetical protein
MFTVIAKVLLVVLINVSAVHRYLSHTQSAINIYVHQLDVDPPSRCYSLSISQIDAYKTLVRKSERRDHLRDLSVAGRLVLKWMLRKQVVGAWIDLSDAV